MRFLYSLRELYRIYSLFSIYRVCICLLSIIMSQNTLVSIIKIINNLMLLSSVQLKI